MIAIKGTEMPKSCISCPIFDGEYGDCNIIGKTKTDATEERAEDCPLQELVTCKDCKHGIKLSDYDYYLCDRFTSTRASFLGFSPNNYCLDSERI